MVPEDTECTEASSTRSRPPTLPTLEDWTILMGQIPTLFLQVFPTRFFRESPNEAIIGTGGGYVT